MFKLIHEALRYGTPQVCNIILIFELLSPNHFFSRDNSIVGRDFDDEESVPMEGIHVREKQ